MASTDWWMRFENRQAERDRERGEIVDLTEYRAEVESRLGPDLTEFARNLGSLNGLVLRGNIA